MVMSPKHVTRANGNVMMMADRTYCSGTKELKVIFDGR
jgi:hypothetical protein